MKSVTVRKCYGKFGRILGSFGDCKQYNWELDAYSKFHLKFTVCTKAHKNEINSVIVSPVL